MSGKEERPIIMPRCKCGGSSAWLVLDAMSVEHNQIMCVNLRETGVRCFGRWNTHHFTKEYIESHATGIRCNGCGDVANLDDFKKLMGSFRREYPGDANERA